MSEANKVDISKLTLADKVLGGSGLVFMVSTFINWFKISVDGALGIGNDFGGGNGWDVGFLWGRLPFLIVLGILAWIAVRLFAPGVKLPDEIPVLYLVGAGLVGLLVTLKLLIGEGDSNSIGISVNRAFGLFIATLAALAFGAGGFLKFTEKGGKMNQVQSQLKQVSTQVSGAAKTAVDSAKEATKEAAKTSETVTGTVTETVADHMPPPPPPTPAAPPTP